MKKVLNINSTFMTYLGLFLLAAVAVAVAMVLAVAYSETSNIVCFSIR